MAVILPSNPSLDFNICQSQDCSGFSFSETTGVFGAANNGWGSPNWTTAQATECTISILFPDGVTTAQVPTTLLFPTFPDSTGQQIANITPSQIGVSSFPDGIYTFTYNVGVTNGVVGVPLTKTKTLVFTCSTKCCIDKLVAKIPLSGCKCDNQHLQTAILAYGLYMSLINAGKCGNQSEVTQLLKTLSRICETVSCGCH